MGEAGVRRGWAALAFSLALADCSTPQYPTRAGAPAPAAPPATPSPVPAPPSSVTSPALPSPAPAQPQRSPVPRAAGGRDQCGAAELQGLVGRPRTEIPVPIEPSRQRVACTTCPITEDFNPARLNFLFDADTGVIKQVRCG
jgi:hypothetical protein